MSIRVAGKYGFSRSPMVKLFDQTLAATGRFDVTGLPPSFTTLLLYAQIRSDVVATNDLVLVFFNGDTTDANYRRVQHTAGSGGHTAGEADDRRANISTAASSPANYFTHTEMILPMYSTLNSTKTMYTFTARREDAIRFDKRNYALHWENTSAISQITVQPDGFAGDEFVINSRLAIYGVY